MQNNSKTKRKPELIRNYKDMFETKEVLQIEDSIRISKRISEILVPLKIHCHEHNRCLIAGSTLGSLLITFSIMECFILTVYAAKIVNSHDDDIFESEIKTLEECESEKVRFIMALKELEKRNILTASQAKELEYIYSEYRIPLSHGLLTKGAFHDESYKSLLNSLFKGQSYSTNSLFSWRLIEDKIEEFVHIENKIFSILEYIIDTHIQTYE